MTKVKLLVKELVSRSIPVSQQTFEFTSGAKDSPSDQYIVDGPALRELLKAYQWKYKTIRKHRNWVPKFTWNSPGNQEVSSPVLEGGGDSLDAKAIWGFAGLVIVGALYLVYAAFFAG